MKDTLLIGDFLFVNKMAYGYSQLFLLRSRSMRAPFSAAASSAPSPSAATWWSSAIRSRGTDFIKRLIGLPGDTIQMRDGVLYINGEPVPQEPAGEFDEVYEPQGPHAQRAALRERPGARSAATASRPLRSRRCRAA